MEAYVKTANSSWEYPRLKWDSHSSPDRKWTDFVQISSKRLEMTESDLKELIGQILDEQDFAKWAGASDVKSQKQFLRNNIVSESKHTFMAESSGIEPVVLNKGSLIDQIAPMLSVRRNGNRATATAFPSGPLHSDRQRSALQSTG